MTIENFGYYETPYGKYDLDWYIVGYVDTNGDIIDAGSNSYTTSNTTTDADGNTIANRTNIALIQCKNSVAVSTFNRSTSNYANWYGCGVRYFLNDSGEFLNDTNFTEAEQDILISTNCKIGNTTIPDISENNRVKYKTNGGAASMEKFFILSNTDINNAVSDFASDDLNPVNIPRGKEYLSNGTLVSTPSPMT